MVGEDPTTTTLKETKRRGRTISREATKIRGTSKEGTRGTKEIKKDPTMDILATRTFKEDLRAGGSSEGSQLSR